MGNSLPCLASHEAKTSKNLKKPKYRRNRRKIMGEEQILANLIHVQEKNDHRQEGEEIKEVIRVKMVLTKKEAARLLSMFAIQNDDNSTVTMLAEIEKRSRRVNSGQGSWRPMLESIPEIDIS